MACVFCDRLVRGNLVAENDLAVAFPDAFPLSPGHCLVVPRRHEPDFLALTAEEQGAVWALVAPVRQHIEAAWTLDGYNFGHASGDPPDMVTTRQFADKIVEIHWPHTLPFAGQAGRRVLRQNTAGQAEIVSAIVRFRERHGRDPSVSLGPASRAARGYSLPERRSQRV